MRPDDDRDRIAGFDGFDELRQVVLVNLELLHILPDYIAPEPQREVIVESARPTSAIGPAETDEHTPHVTPP